MASALAERISAFQPGDLVATVEIQEMATQLSQMASLSAAQQKVALPDGYLDDLDDETPPGEDAEVLVSGG